MIELVKYEDDFLAMYKKEPRKIVAYGAGECLRKNYAKLPCIDCICDKNADNIDYEIMGKKVYKPEKIMQYDEKIYIVIFVYDSKMFWEIYEQLKGYAVSAKVIAFNNNIAFGYSYGETIKSYQLGSNLSKLKVNIVCQEKAWIFKKFADRMFENLSKQNIEVYVSPYTRTDVDINHHIPYVAYEPYPNDTLMITHVDNTKKILLLKKQLQIAGMGICMSRDTMNQLVSYGIPRSKLCYINPAQDNVVEPHKYVIGITHRCYDNNDLRKRATEILDVLEGVNPQYFRFIIMGSGWNNIVLEMEKRGFEVEYYTDFDYSKYNLLLQQMDYFLYMGFDEGTMGYLDALAAGIGTIVTPQGYHLDVDCPIDYPCRTVKQFREAFLDLQSKREKKINSVREWTWENYSFKHLEIWYYLLHRKSLKELYDKQSLYEDGIYSVMLEDNRV